MESILEKLVWEEAKQKAKLASKIEFEEVYRQFKNLIEEEYKKLCECLGSSFVTHKDAINEATCNEVFQMLNKKLKEKLLKKAKEDYKEIIEMEEKENEERKRKAQERIEKIQKEYEEIKDKIHEEIDNLIDKKRKATTEQEKQEIEQQIDELYNRLAELDDEEFEETTDAYFE